MKNKGYEKRAFGRVGNTRIYAKSLLSTNPLLEADWKRQTS